MTSDSRKSVRSLMLVKSDVHDVGSCKVWFVQRRSRHESREGRNWIRPTFYIYTEGAPHYPTSGCPTSRDQPTLSPSIEGTRGGLCSSTSGHLEECIRRTDIRSLRTSVGRFFRAIHPGIFRRSNTKILFADEAFRRHQCIGWRKI